MRIVVAPVPEPPKLTDWISAWSGLGSAFFAAVATVAALIAIHYTKKAAEESEKATNTAAISAKAAQDQVEMQRPRPVLVVSGSWNRSNIANELMDIPLQVRNIGNSAAFNIEIAGLALPADPEGSIVELDADSIFDLDTVQPKPFGHRLKVNGSWTQNLVFPARNFMGQVFDYFRSQPSYTSKTRTRPTISFVIYYSGLDKRRFPARCKLVLDFDCERAWIEPDTSWLVEPLPQSQSTDDRA